ncbi:MAG: AEC family transporter [Leptolyngbyaceae cyanobacterium SL_7_1]|nr:AEC family transporter [Leptolyngbyaceae cyanobacterium SL_7_1]
MTDSLIQAYAPLILWTALGLLLCRILPHSLPRLLGRGLYWVGVPLQIFTLARQTQWQARVEWASVVTIAALVGGLLLAWASLWLVQWIAPVEPAEELAAPIEAAIVTSEAVHPAARQGSFVLSSMIGNTGFVGLAIVPTFVHEADLGWVVLYSVTHNLVGSYGLGVLLASYYGRKADARPWWHLLRDVLTVPSLWAFAVGFGTRSLIFPAVIDTGLHIGILVVIPAALTLMGMRLSQLQGWRSLRLAVVPAALKVVAVPGLVGLSTTVAHLPPAPQLAMVLMSGMPTAFAGLILAEEYNLDRELIASSILLSTMALLLTIPLWLWLFG